MLIEVADPTQVLAALADAERPGPDALAGHVAATGFGQVWADRPSRPGVVVVRCSNNVMVRGDVDSFAVDSFAVDPAPDGADGSPVTPVTGWVDAPASFEPQLRAVDERFVAWQRMVFVLDGDPAPVPPPPLYATVRRLTGADAAALAGLDDDLAWVWTTWPSPRALADAELAWGAFARGELVSVACTFFAGARHEDIGVVTASRFRRLGLSTRAAHGLCQDIRSRGRTPSWTTWLENEASRRTAQRLGFHLDHERPVYLVGIDPPQ